MDEKVQEAIREFDSGTIQPLLFWILAGITGGCAVATALTQNIVRSATWLLFTLAGVASLFFLLGADLVGAVQLLVYVGGTLILLVFGVMLTAQGPFVHMKASGGEWALSIVAGVALFAVLAMGAHSLAGLGPRGDSVVQRYGSKVPDANPDPAKSRDAAVIGLAFSGVGQGPAHQDGDKIVRMHYLFPFEIVSVHLLVVLIGAAYLARTKKRPGSAKP